MSAAPGYAPINPKYMEVVRYDVNGEYRRYIQQEVDDGRPEQDGFVFIHRFASAYYTCGYNTAEEESAAWEESRRREVDHYVVQLDYDRLIELRDRYLAAGSDELAAYIAEKAASVYLALESGGPTEKPPAQLPSSPETDAAGGIAATYNNEPTYIQEQSTTTVTQSTTISGTDPNPDIVIATYVDDSDFIAGTVTKDFNSLPVKFSLTPHSTQKLVPGSVIFSFDSDIYYDRNGRVVTDFDPETGAGVDKGSINYKTGEVVIGQYDQITSPKVSILGGLARFQGNPPSSYVFRTPSAPLLAGSFSVRGSMLDGSQLSALANNQDKIVFDGSGYLPSMRGTINSTTGVVRLDIGRWRLAEGNEEEPWYAVDMIQEGGVIWEPIGLMPETAMYNCVGIRTLPLDSTLIGIEPIRLPSDGRVPIFKSGDVVVLHHTLSEAIGTGPFSDSQVITLSRDRLSIADVYDYEGNIIPDDRSIYTIDLVAGTLTVVNGSQLNSYTNGNAENVMVNHRIEDMLLLSEAQINGYLTSVGPITHNYPATGTQLSTALILGDLAGRVTRLFHQKTWDSVWRDSISGSSTSAKYDTVNYPFIITNEGSANQRWCLKFTSSSSIQVIGETFGIIGEYNIANPIAPINPATGAPYFTIDPNGWGSGWATGNNIRFDTSAANYPVWIARTTMQGEVTNPTDNFVLQIRGDAN
jgi:hypothetical protein